MKLPHGLGEALTPREVGTVMGITGNNVAMIEGRAIRLLWQRQVRPDLRELQRRPARRSRLFETLRRK